MDKKNNNGKNEKQSSDKLASKAAKALNSGHTSSLTKSFAGSVLSQAKGKNK